MTEEDFKRLAARQTALTGVVMAMLTHMKKVDLSAHADIGITAGNYINSQIHEGTAEHKEALEFLRFTLQSEWKSHP